MCSNKIDENSSPKIFYTKDGYRRDSMDRFGDDMCELILSELNFEEKVRLECVSKQWKRCVFQREAVLSVLEIECNDIKEQRELDKHFVEFILKKCRNIKIVDISEEVSSEVLSVIGRYCPHIRSLAFNTNSVENLEFFRDNGCKLVKLIVFNGYNEFIILQLCPNVKEVYVKNFSVILNEDRDFFPKLERIHTNLWIESRGLNKLQILSDKYSRTMKSLKVIIGYLTEEELKTSIECIARFKNLTELQVLFKLVITEVNLDCLSQIGQKCTKLLKLELNIDNEIPISDRFFDVFTHFKAIMKLKINLSETTVLKGSVESLKHCKQLNDLQVMGSGLTEDFFTNIASFVPKLKFLKISTDQQFSDTFIHSFNLMKCIRKVELSVNDRYKYKIYRK